MFPAMSVTSAVTVWMPLGKVAVPEAAPAVTVNWPICVRGPLPVWVNRSTSRPSATDVVRVTGRVYVPYGPPAAVGEVIATVGGVMSTSTVRFTVVSTPAPLFRSKRRASDPSGSVTSKLKAPLPLVVAVPTGVVDAPTNARKGLLKQFELVPLTTYCNPAAPAFRSSLMFSVATFGVATTRLHGTVFTTTPSSWALPRLPARSVTSAVTVCVPSGKVPFPAATPPLTVSCAISVRAAAPTFEKTWTINPSPPPTVTLMGNVNVPYGPAAAVGEVSVTTGAVMSTSTARFWVVSTPAPLFSSKRRSSAPSGSVVLTLKAPVALVVAVAMGVIDAPTNTEKVRLKQSELVPSMTYCRPAATASRSFPRLSAEAVGWVTIRLQAVPRTSTLACWSCPVFPAASTVSTSRVCTPSG